MERTNLKVFRIKKKMSQAKFAKELGYSRNHYARIENGSHEAPLKLLVALSKKYGMTLDEARELTKTDNERSVED